MLKSSFPFAFKTRRERLILQINQNLDFLMGSISSKGNGSNAFNLTSKVDRKTVSRSIPVALTPLVRKMNAKHKKLKKLLTQLDQLNWEMIKTGVDLHGS
jgi:hypothetical protein